MVYLLAVAHAVMWTRISSILGSVVSKSVLTHANNHVHMHTRMQVRVCMHVCTYVCACMDGWMDVFNSLSQTAILGTVFISAAAYRLIQSGIIIYYANEGQNSFSLTALGRDMKLEAQTYEKTLFSGGLLLCLFWVRTIGRGMCLIVLTYCVCRL